MEVTGFIRLVDLLLLLSAMYITCGFLLLSIPIDWIAIDVLPTRGSVGKALIPVSTCSSYFAIVAKKIMPKYS